MYIYELITLHQPFYDLSPAQVKQMIVDGQRPPLSPKVLTYSLRDDTVIVDIGLIGGVLIESLFRFTIITVFV